MDTLFQDLRYAIRTLARSPGFTAAAVVALALGVGGSSAIFSVLEGVVLRPLAAPQPEQLVRLYETVPGDAPGHDRNPYSTQALDKDQPLANPRTLEAVIGESLGERRFPMMLLTVFGVVALVLASLGIYGVMAYSVAQRAKEIGIRMALGAPTTQVLRTVVGSGMRLAVIGVGIGLSVALLVSVVVTEAAKATLYEVSTTDPVTFLAVSVLLLGVAALASWAPARRASRVDPMLSLRAE